jgi:hypothetical protein
LVLAVSSLAVPLTAMIRRTLGERVVAGVR